MKIRWWWLLVPVLLLSGMTWPSPPAKARIEYLYSFRTAEDLKIKPGTGAKVLEFIFGRGKADQAVLVRPQGVFAADQRVLVTDTALGCVHVFDRKEQRYFKIAAAGNGPLLSPIGVVVDAGERIYVTDSRLNKVLRFAPNGDFLGELGQGRWRRPTGITLDRTSGRIYVVDTLDCSVSVFGPDGAFRFKFGARGARAGSFNHPTYAAVGKNGDLYVMDTLNFRVQIFSPEGKFKKTFGKIGRVPGCFALPKGVALDSDQNIYVADAAFDNVQIFNGLGALLLFFGESGNKAGEFWQPAGVHIDADDIIYVADSLNSRVMVFKHLP